MVRPVLVALLLAGHVSHGPLPTPDENVPSGHSESINRNRIIHNCYSMTTK